MLSRTVRLIFAVTLVFVLIGCEGEQGPAGPTGLQGDQGDPGPGYLLAYADVDMGGTGARPILSSGPPEVTVAANSTGDGLADVTFTGTFPVETGVVLVSISSDQATEADCFLAAEITSWTTTQIVVHVEIYDAGASVFWDEDFSIVVFGD